MLGLKRGNILAYERGFLFKNGELSQVLKKGRYTFIDLKNELKLETLSMRNTWIDHDKLDIIIKSGLIDHEIEIIDLKDTQRALVWIEGRFEKILNPGLYALWKTHRTIRVEILETDTFRFTHREFNTIITSHGTQDVLEIMTIPENHRGILYREGRYETTLTPGSYAFYKKSGETRLYFVDKREITLDVSGQDMITQDKVTLRCNTLLTYTVQDDLKSVEATGDTTQSLYRETQLALRAVIGGLILDDLLSQKENTAMEIERQLQTEADRYGVRITGIGIKDIILPGDMKDLMNKVIEAENKAKANLISRREETAAMRSQANTAKLLESNPALMRLKELEILEKMTTNSKLNLVLGDKGLGDRVMNLL